MNFSSRRMMSSCVNDIKLAKKVLRKEIRLKVAAISPDDKVKQSRIVTEKVTESRDFQNAKSLSLYLHMDDEIITEDILKTALKRGKKCYIPRYFMGGNCMEMVELYDMQDYETLPLTKWNIKQPGDDEKRPEALEQGSLDLMLIPGMAFSLKGQRLGRGKGYYDTYLSKAESLGIRPKTLALAFNEQIMPEIPCDSHDFTIDSIIYPNEK